MTVLLVSNRGPVSFARSADGFEVRRGAGGLAGALDPVARRLGDDALWLAAAGSRDDRAALAAGETARLRDRLGYPVHLLDVDDATYSAYYDTVSNRMLWFAAHCLWDELGIDGFEPEAADAFDRAYTGVNRRFADAVAGLAGPDPLVLVQDYHLDLVPGLVRGRRPDATIAHFTHTSFCAAGLDRVPERIARAVIEGMLGADLLGFHVPAWADGFMRRCRALGFEVDEAAGSVAGGGATTWVRTYPIPIDASSLARRAEGPDATRWHRRIERERTGPVIVRADRTEPSKNIVRGFEAFGLLLDRRPDLRGRARFVACLYESRQGLPEYRRYAAAIHAAVDAVNDRHPGAIDMFVEDDYDRTLGALAGYDVLLVNSIMDGMNLVSKEGPVVNRRDGVVVLSRTAGSHAELGGHVVEIADPFDVDATAKALEVALELPAAERRARAAALRRMSSAGDPQGWIQSQIEDLGEIRAGRPPLTRPPGS